LLKAENEQAVIALMKKKEEQKGKKKCKQFSTLEKLN
jgi:hypothetical protein